MARRGMLVVALPLVLAACAAAPAPQPQVPPPGSSPASTSPSPLRRSTPTPKPAPADTLLAAQDLAKFEDRFGRDAAVAVAALDGSDPITSSVAGEPYAWSTVKAVIVAQTLLDSDGPSGLDSQQRDLIRQALSASDNEAAAALHEQVMARHGGLQGAADTMERLLRKAGDDRTQISTESRADFSTYGQTRWLPGEQVRFLAALARGCLLDRESTEYLLQEMSTVVPDQRWGLGLADSPAFKGGWGPDPDGRYLVRQFGLVEAADGHEYAVAILTRPGNGSFETGKGELGQLATWVGDRVVAAPARTGCD